jgi:hypothetical protein
MSQPVLDITDRKAKLGRELYTALYYLPDTGKMIIAPTNVNEAGVYYEQNRATLLEPPLDSVELGRRARAALTAFDMKPQYLRNRKASDWAAYRVSGMKSIRAFEHAAIRVTIETINATLRLEAWPKLNGTTFVGGYLSPSAEHSEMGALIKQVVACSQKLRADRLAQAAEPAVAPDCGGITVFQTLTSHQPPRQVNGVVPPPAVGHLPTCQGPSHQSHVEHTED